MKITPIYLLLGMLFISPLAQAIPTLESLLLNRSTLEFSDYQSNGLIMNAHNSDTFSYQMNFKKNSRGLMLNVRTKLTQSQLQLDKQFNVLSATFNVMNDELVKKLSYNLRSALRNQFDEVVFKYFLNHEKIRDKGVYYTRNTLDTFSIIPILQFISQYEISAFTADFSVQHMAIKIPVLIQKETTHQLMPFFSRYTLPKPLEDHLKTTNTPYTVYTLMVKGWQGFIYNHRHYYVFTGKAPYTYVGHWGGQDKTNLFSWATNP